MKLKSIRYIATLLFCGIATIFFMACTTVPSGQTHERYVSQADIDNFIENFDDITNDDDLEILNTVDFFHDVPPTAKMLVAQLGDHKQALANTLKEYGMNSKHPIETFYTILLGSFIVQMDAIMKIVLETEEEYEQAMEEMQSNPNFLAFFELKESIHPEDLSLLSENLENLLRSIPIGIFPID